MIDIETVRAEPVEAQHGQNPSASFTPGSDEGSGRPELLLSARNLSVRFGGVLAVNNVSFDVKPGEVFTLIGPNGAGKTTVFNLISRIYTPTGGTIEYEGKVLTEQPPHNIASLGIARTFQNI